MASTKTDRSGRKKIGLIQAGLLIMATALILLILPSTDHQSYTYELNQPWRYQLLTADFDMPIMRDSTSLGRIRDSIAQNFINFVKLDPTVADTQIERFRKLTSSTAAPAQVAEVSRLLRQVYDRGLTSVQIYNRTRAMKTPRLRVSAEMNGVTSVETIDASKMLGPIKAYDYIDSAYRAHPSLSATYPLDGEVAKALNLCLVPNYVSDTENNEKFRSQEEIVANGALGVIKRGQRIVDRGEIVTPQIFTNLNTYISMLEKNNDTAGKQTYFVIGQALYILMIFGVLYLYLHLYRYQFYTNWKKMCFLMVYITLFVVASILMFEFVPGGLYFLPFAAVPVIIMIFFDSRTAVFALMVTVMLASLVAVDPLRFIFLQLSVGIVATFSIHQLSQRSQLLRTAGLTFVVYVLGYIAMSLLNEGNLENFQWTVIGIFGLNAVALSFAYILMLIVERLFGFTSVVTLVELSDINNPLLRRLAEEAPGTFQHSMQVSTLASEAARAIGANTQLVRTGALYHDIGKLESPIFFTENQHGVNPHVGLNPETSAQKIISHVTSGLQLASKAKLPEVIRNFITEHQGRGITKYFYNTAVNQNPDMDIDRSRFQYPGPNPQSRETAIVMMADAVEAASRSLKDYSQASIDALVDKVIDGQSEDGMFKEAPISYRDVETVKDTFKRRLATIYHSRVAYPELKKSSADQAKKSSADQAKKSSADQAKDTSSEGAEKQS